MSHGYDHSHTARDTGAAEDRHSHDINDVRGAAEERHYHDNSDLRGTPDNGELARTANDVRALEREVAGLQAQLRAELIANEALRKSSLNARSFVQTLRLHTASLRATAELGGHFDGAMMTLADLLDSIADSTESEIPK